MKTETIDKLYMELSQITSVRNNREIMVRGYLLEVLDDMTHGKLKTDPIVKDWAEGLRLALKYVS